MSRVVHPLPPIGACVYLAICAGLDAGYRVTHHLDTPGCVRAANLDHGAARGQVLNLADHHGDRLARTVVR